MDNFYMTQQLPKPFDEKPNLDFSKTLGNMNPYNTFKSQATFYTTFQKTNFLKNEDNTYNNIKLLYSIVSNFLSKMNLNYTLKTFNDEIKTILNPNTTFTEEEMFQILNISNDEDNNFKTTNNLFSQTLNTTYLNYLINTRSNINKVNKGIQTILNEENNKNDNISLKSTLINSNSNIFEDLDEQLKKIDEKYQKKSSNNDPTFERKNNLESKFNRYKKELNEKYKEDMQNEIERIKTIEVGKIIIEQNQKYLDNIEKIRKEYETKFEIKNKELTEKQKILKEKENKLQQEFIEKTKELISQYQQKIENFYKKEEAFNQKCIKELNEIKEQKKQLDKKDKELFVLKKDFNKILQKEIDKLKEEFKVIYKEQLKKIYNEKEKEIEKISNELRLTKMANNLNSTLELNTTKANEACLKNLIEIKEKLIKIKSENNEKNSELNKKIIPISDINQEQAKIDIDYYEKISELESQFNSIVNKFKYKHFNTDAFQDVNIKTDLIVKDEVIQNKMDELEKMENEINLEIKKELNKFKEEIPQINLTKKEIEKIKEDNYKIVLSNIEKEKQLNEIYKKEKDEESIKNKIKYINEINQNIRNNYVASVDRNNYIIINKNEMDNHKNMYLKLYREKREQQIIEENIKKEELIKNLELLETVKKEKQIKWKDKEKEIKPKEKNIEEKSQFSKSIALPPVKNPKEKKMFESALADEIEELIHKSKIRIAESKESKENKENKENKEKQQIKERIKISNNSQEEDEYGSGDFVDLSNEDKKSKSRTKNEITNKSNRIASITNKENASDSYNDFETTNALNKQGILSEQSEKTKSNDDFKF